MNTLQFILKIIPRRLTTYYNKRSVRVAKELLEKRGIREGFPYVGGVTWQYCREPPCQRVVLVS